MIKKIVNFFKRKRKDDFDEDGDIPQEKIEKVIKKSNPNYKSEELAPRNAARKPVGAQGGSARSFASSKQPDFFACDCGGTFIKKGTIMSGNSKFEVYKCKQCNKEKMRAVQVMH